MLPRVSNQREQFPRQILLLSFPRMAGRRRRTRVQRRARGGSSGLSFLLLDLRLELRVVVDAGQDPAEPAALERLL